MALLDHILEPPSYGYEREGKFYLPSKPEMFREFFGRLNFFKDKRNWAPAFCWFSTAILGIPFVAFFGWHFSIPLFIAAFLYSMVLLGTHGTIYYHRYATHRAYKYSHPFWLFLVKNMVIKIIPDELYVVSHHVHHYKSERPGDPYNVNGGFWYCFLADVIHQPIARNLSPEDYLKVTKMLDHTGIHINSHAQYLKWGSVCHPGWTFLHFALNWAFWYGAFYLLGGHGLAIAMFAAAGFWGFGVRTFNFDGHGAGKDKRKDGIDFNRDDLSINQLWPGLVTGEWHNNHHLFPSGARAGFQPYQWDYAWWFIKGCNMVGIVSQYRDYKELFDRDYLLPYLAKRNAAREGKLSY